MPSEIILGFSIIMLGAVCSGTFALPHKFVKGYNWENTWGAFFALAMIIIPALVTWFLVEGLVPAWQRAGLAAVTVPILFGFLWGCGAILFGIGVSMIGLSLG